MTKQAHSTRTVKPKRPSQLERDLRASIQIAKLQLRISNLEAAVLALQRWLQYDPVFAQKGGKSPIVNVPFQYLKP